MTPEQAIEFFQSEYASSCDPSEDMNTAPGYDRAINCLIDVVCQYNKLPTYADTGERFMPGVDECWIVAKTELGTYIPVSIVPYNGSEPGDEPHWGFFEGGDYFAICKESDALYRTYEAAQAEADRLNEETNDD